VGGTRSIAAASRASRASSSFASDATHSLTSEEDAILAYFVIASTMSFAVG
jgi:hypothetical protein